MSGCCTQFTLARYQVGELDGEEHERQGDAPAVLLAEPMEEHQRTDETDQDAEGGTQEGADVRPGLLVLPSLATHVVPQ